MGMAFGIGPPFYNVTEHLSSSASSISSRCVLSGGQQEINKVVSVQTCFVVFCWQFWPHKSHIGIGGGVCLVTL